MLNLQKQPISSFMVAPMMGWTTRHYRYFFRLICKKAQLYTEMLTTGAILNNPQREHLLAFHASEKALAIQLGGGIASELAQASKMVEPYGYSEINLNVGCPSDRVQSGCFGAVLLKDPARVADCIAEMCAAVKLPITVKTRIGVDDYESYDYLAAFIQQVSLAGCQTFIIHARKAWLSGLSPKENREIPPLNYKWVYHIKRDFPHLNIVLNGGIACLSAAQAHLQQVDGVMLGRAAWHNPYLFAELDQLISPQDAGIIPSRLSLVLHYLPYLEEALRSGENLTHLIQPLFGLFHGVAGGRRWRQKLSEILQEGNPLVRIKEVLREIVPSA
ncbi:tRNA dihydrouridine(20/20a) synthase DusA [Rickettsiella endosymbiont of Litargus connexus]|jgi:tRNA-dihydrouridine synthase A|uniref:tRNA dihydrouridine(20/20a) synthase DusA n=1 Tax=Rickettsiella endosymbiont of Litargus connexus TaxID=3066237 RepID=UPI0027ED4B87|nr:tRNA dihydrouridine(20/20a) synthase DusA [Gammaproteobacteria bacterium]MCH9754295.1 tRNA dihydrouridine(20/20a) synthase DusA [Gammaproteobacteria bacterium]MDD4893415.1 tRNA dihydrouridine(20/20a) synthase DusA [Candidatus Rickettsiella isopodorum]MDD5162330.1 tRNA dihydrouridine(20/20a) synthase DusA [Candidatus Rickettsiella isopodorum]MDQ5900236.1 tRNA-dihydrouridine synthase [Pseudomonadota bacterium]